ncbi:unnamed protein product [Rotaria socialis]|uniref:AAA+ ATPase domain-containing protein n=1 Tax=Rotaria socialis TaxID=392032 RepID=A0A819VGU7_9BILA|nr:unnamed protein product [Rotaria socialis]CAF4109003.1 unnamed protein product [Rotaria socialis]
MSDNSSDDDFTPEAFQERSTDTTINFVVQKLLPPLEPVTLNSIVLNIYIKFDKGKQVEAFIEELKQPNENLHKGADGQYVSTLHQYALESTRGPIDMSNQSVRLIYQPNLFTRRNDAFGPWNFNYLLTLLALDYQCDHDSKFQFPPVWKTNSKTQVHVVVKNIQNEITTSPETASSTTVSTKKEDVTLESFLKTICRQNQRDENSVTSWLTALQATQIINSAKRMNIFLFFLEESITTVQHLRSAVANERCWESLQSPKLLIKQMIRDYIQLNDSSSKSQETQSLYKDSDATLIGDIHRIRRYFHYVTKTEQYIPYLDPDAVDKTINEIRKTYDDDGNVLHNIHQYLKTFCIKNKNIDLEAHKKRKQEWTDEQKRLEEEVKTFRKEILISEEEAKGAQTKVRVCQQHFINAEKEKEIALKEAEKLNAEAATLNWSQDLTAWTRKRDQAKEKVGKATQDVEKVQRQLEIAQAKLAVHTEPIRRKKNTIAENEEKIRGLTTFLKIDPIEAQKKLNVKYGRGLLLYGPPGTGKSELLKRAATFAGITMTTTALAAGELNRPYVGETERLLVDIMSRANTIPYLICAMTIDEIDGLVPKRTNNAQQSKVDGISVLLSHIEGVKNIQNLIVLGATNRKNMMDEAFLRRMQSKCFVGRPSPQIRRKMLEPLLYLDANMFNEKCMDFLVKITTNFSGAAVGALKSSIVVAMDSYKSTNLTNKVFLDLADNTAREFSCWFGIGTLPEICRLYPNIFSSNDQQEKYSLKLPDSLPTGRILIDLDSRKRYIEFKTEPTIEDDLDQEETSTMTLVSRFISGCFSRNIDAIQIIDLNFLTKNNAFEDSGKFELLTTIFDECEEYNRSMLVFDIDSLIMLNVTDSAMSPSTSISNIQLYQCIREKCKRAVVERNSTDERTQTDMTFWKEKWIVMIVKNPYLRKHLVDEIEFKKTLQETQQKHEDEQKRIDNETVTLCPKCLQSYIPSKVDHGSCRYHNGYIIDLDNPTKILTQDDAQQIIQRVALDAAMTTNNENPNQKAAMPFLYWACCSSTFMSGQPCKIGTCGLPETMKGQTIGPNEDLILLVQKHFQEDQQIKENAARLVKHYQEKKRSIRSTAQTTTNIRAPSSSSSSTVSSLTQRK